MLRSVQEQFAFLLTVGCKMPRSAPRRWYQFGLRTMFVAVTLFAIWLGWDLRTIRERKSVKQWIEANGGDCRTLPEMKGYPGGLPDESLSAWQRWLGGESIFYITLPRMTTEADCSRIKNAFAEIPRDYPLLQRRYWSPWSPVDEDEWRSLLVQ